MYDAGTASKSELETHVLQRVNGEARLRFRQAAGCTRLADLYQAGSAKIRFPKVYDAPPTAVLINTAGGLTGGDRMVLSIGADAKTHAIVTSQTAERAYRSAAGSAEVTVGFTLEPGAFLEWLPQETILFQASRLKRRISAALTGDARLLMLESAVLGRKAMGEQVTSVLFRDSWRILRDGRLVFADDLRFDGDPARFLKGKATGHGSLAIATMVDCALDAEDRLARARSLLDDLTGTRTQAAASAWNGILAARFVAEDGQALRATLTRFLTGYRSAELPRVWHC
ncbi:urease accessory protein UreD [Roseibium sediminicola]|uniref:Urease accessory protein UreD n=1 Tax=Roseibium sediminicola TaxID=2933272 RepID=A0ABT0GZF6_9HYPH|nr:urease accessory protein UreD [Roseibium sp. CAU 1639]MCK7614457.1 urease accessory protein UreD [Roseibium sp. CAU 1639]